MDGGNLERFHEARVERNSLDSDEVRVSIGIDTVFCFFLAFARIGAVMVSMPQMLGVGVPLKLRLLLGMLLAGALMNRSSVEMPNDNGLIPMAILLGREIAIGFSLSFATAVVTGAALLAGELLGATMELNSGGILRGMAATPNVLADGLGALAGLLFFVGGFHRALLLALGRSLEVFPLGRPSLPTVTALIGMCGRLFVIAFDLALPLLVPLAMIAVAQGIIGRLAPQVNVLIAAPAAVVLAGLVLLGLDSSGLAWGITRAWSSITGQILGLVNAGS
jgi:flagellar biosynthesis protein FliR